MTCSTYHGDGEGKTPGQIARRKRNATIRRDFDRIYNYLRPSVPAPAIEKAAKRQAFLWLAVYHKLTVERLRQIVGNP